MPFFLASLALLIAAIALLIAAVVIGIGWIRQDRAIRAMQRNEARRAARNRNRP